MANRTHEIRSSDTGDARVARADMKLERRCHPRPGCRPREGVLQEARVEAGRHWCPLAGCPLLYDRGYVQNAADSNG